MQIDTINVSYTKVVKQISYFHYAYNTYSIIMKDKDMVVSLRELICFDENCEIKLMIYLLRIATLPILFKDTHTRAYCFCN